MKNIIFIVLATLLVACSDSDRAAPDTASTADKPIVVASNYPLYYFAREIAGDIIDVHFPSIDGDPAMWAPKGEDMALLQSADLLILNGAGYESWLAFTTLQEDRLLNTTAMVESSLLPIENSTVHQHGPQGEHSHEGTAFTTWLDPELATGQARAILQGYVKLIPDQSDLFNTNFIKLEQRLDQLDQSLNQAIAALGDQPIIFSHPVYQYLQQRYGINGRSVHWEPGVEPGTADWIELGKILRQHPAKLMIWEGSPMDSVREKLIQMGVRSVVFDTAANPESKAEYLEIMRQNIASIQ